ncbi:MAG: iron ABC transporter permease [Chloroflexi bacterium]|nr:iron ABC transporter permease [Chloroflexota bacterium]
MKPFTRAGQTPPGLLLLGGLVALVTLIPLVFVAVYSVLVGPQEAYRLIVRPRVGELFGNTLSLIALVLPLCAGIGTGAAWLVERTRVPGRRVWGVLLAAPLVVPAFINGFAWVSLTARVEGFPGAVMIVTLSYFPLVYLPVVGALRGIDPALEESARALGYGPWRTLLRVVAPQLRPAILGGMLLVGLHLLAEFGALQMLRFPTFTTAIYDQFQSTFNGPAANVLAGVLVACSLVLLVAEAGLAGRTRYARLGMGVARPATRARLGPLGTAGALAALVGLVVLALGVPLGSIALWLVTGSSTTFAWDVLASTTLSTLGLGVAGAVLTTLMALPVAWLSVRYRGAATLAVERSTYIGHALPGIVVALALVTVTVRFLPPLYQTTPLLLVAYAILFIPLATVSIRASLLQAPPVLDEAARALGSRPLEVMRRVTLPLIAPGVGVGAALVFLAIVTELTATLLLAPTGTDTLATRFWSNAESIAYGASAPYALVMVALSAPSTYLLTRDIRRRVQR